MDPVQKALWYVESHSREPITLEEIAADCKISAFHLTRSFAATMGLSFDSDSNFDYLCGVEVSDASDLPKSITSLQVAGQKYAVFAHRGHVAGIRATIATIWNKGIPESGCQVANAPTLERYGPEFNPLTGMGGFEIWVPVQP